MFLTDRASDKGDGLSATGVIIWRKYCFWKITTPQLPRYDIHLALHADKFLFSIRQNLIGCQACVEDHLQLFRKQLPPETPFRISTESTTVFEKHLMFVQCQYSGRAHFP